MGFKKILESLDLLLKIDVFKGAKPESPKRLFHTEDGSNNFLWIIVKYLSDYTVSQ
jgi:hypothetical protein